MMELEVHWWNTRGLMWSWVFWRTQGLESQAGAGGWKSQLASAVNFPLGLSLFALSLCFILKIRPVVLAHLPNKPYKAAEVLEMLSPWSHLHGVEGNRPELQLVRKSLQWKVALPVAGMGFKVPFLPSQARGLWRQTKG